jgi:TRAP-type C4-dicarboxylate transport system substrate-binding protein
MRKPARHLAEFKNTKIRVLASPFQLELIRRMGASPVAMTLGDVLPALQQGAIDGSLSAFTVFTPMQYHEAAKYVTETDQPYISSIVVMSRRWLDALPADLQKIVRDDAQKASQNIVSFVRQFLDEQRRLWIERGGELIRLPAGEQAAMIEKVSSIGDDMSKSKPELNKAVKVVFESAKKNR